MLKGRTHQEFRTEAAKKMMNKSDECFGLPVSSTVQRRVSHQITTVYIWRALACKLMNDYE